MNKLLNQQIQKHFGSESDALAKKFKAFFKDIQDTYDHFEKERMMVEHSIENKYSELFETMVDGAYKSSHEGKFIDVNPAFVKMLGYGNKEELMSIDIKSKLYFETSDRDNAMSQDQSVGISVFRLRKKDGSEIWVEDRGQYISDENGKVLYHRGILRDVTKRVQTGMQLQKSEKEREEQQDALENSNRELIKSNLELDKFVYSVSHDLRAPLSSMKGIIEISEEDTDDPIVLKNFGILKGSVKKLDDFIQDLLDYSRSTRMEGIKQEINLKDLLEDITTNLMHMSSNNHRQVELTFEINSPRILISDKNRISIILNNLISNAIRYQDAARENPSVGVTINMSDTETGIIIKDNGIGIDKENQEKIFEMFYRISDNSVGSGLGLYLVKEIVEKLHGRIEIKSELGIGTSISVHLPNEVTNN